jgi:hypothetical protein
MGVDGGMNGTRLAASMKKNPTTMTNRHTETLTSTSRLVTRADSRTPRTAIQPSTSTMSTAPRLTTESSPNSEVGRNGKTPCR